jgi:bifunctional non-homologous end joining protein LigD
MHGFFVHYVGRATEKRTCIKKNGSLKNWGEKIQRPMLCETGDLSSLKKSELEGETKWDGTRVLVDRTQKVTVYNRYLIDYTYRLKEVREAASKVRAADFHLDGEATVIDPSTGAEDFTACQKRCSTQDFASQIYLQSKYPITYEAFDIMRLDGIDLTLKPYSERKQILLELIDGMDVIKFVPSRKDLSDFFEETKAKDQEGLIAKDINSRYEFNMRSYNWLKIKNWRQVTGHVIGYTPGKNARAFFFGSLVLEKDSKYLGCVGSGFDTAELYKIKSILKSSPEVAPPFSIGESYTAVKTDLQVRAQYYKISRQGNVMREPVFLEIVN